MLKTEQQIKTFSPRSHGRAVRTALFTPVPLAFWACGFADRRRAFASGPKTYEYFRIMRHLSYMDADDQLGNSGSLFVIAARQSSMQKLTGFT